MTSAEIDAYLDGLDPAKRETLQAVRARILEVVPRAEEGLSYAVPAFRVDGILIAGLSSASRHLSYLPHSGAVLESLDPETLAGYQWSKGALRFRVGEPLTVDLLRTLIEARAAEAGVALG